MIVILFIILMTITRTRMHSSRMRTTHFSGRLGGKVCPGGVCLGGCLPRRGVCLGGSVQGGLPREVCYSMPLGAV